LRGGGARYKSLGTSGIDVSQNIVPAKITIIINNNRLIIINVMEKGGWYGRGMKYAYRMLVGKREGETTSVTWAYMEV
jgi:hypothetical protein